MSFMADKLRWRIEIRKPVQNPSADGGFEKKYDVVAKVWADMKPLSFGSRASYAHTSFVRNKQINEGPTHYFMMRKAPSLGIDFLGDEPRLTNDYFIFLPANNGRGRSFRITGVIDKDERNELVQVLAQEREDQSSAQSFINNNG